MIIPSRSQKRQIHFLRRSVKSIRAQTIAASHAITIIIATDKGDGLDAATCADLGVQCVESESMSQAAALNAAIRTLDCDYVAFLEDDDRWQPHFLEIVALVIGSADFVSSNQMEFDEDGNILRYLDFPTPSGWFMPLATLTKIGLFNEDYRYHLDNEWLGRLNQAGLNRVHLVDRFVPDDAQQLAEQRLDLYLLLEAVGNDCRILRHEFPFPLVQRYVHAGSGMAQIALAETSRQLSLQEYETLKSRFGCIPT